jgi:hypothetical protein
MSARKRNSTRAVPAHVEYIHQVYRKKIETGFSVLNRLNPDSTHAVTARGFELKVFLFVLACNIDAPYKSQLGLDRYRTPLVASRSVRPVLLQFEGPIIRGAPLPSGVVYFSTGRFSKASGSVEPNLFATVADRGVIGRWQRRISFTQPEFRYATRLETEVLDSERIGGGAGPRGTRL